ncbi:MAG: hypothetical protein K9M49_02160 [Candidatus Marinimicrobia bacterium]|nr:hypothetical protein [Candidatus Neomarinimicrobiota bacterium]MCF7903935.1 hypothetical protein [Candidatus Neomarinimicrobiota bacterium]
MQINPIHLSFLSDDASDALLYVRYEGFKRSGGSTAAGAVGGVALGLLTGVVVVPVPEGGGFQAALIEKGTGKILWNNIANEGSYSMENRLESLLDKFPLQGADLSLSIGRGKAVENSFRVEDHGFDNKPLPVPGEDRVLLDDGQEYLGEVIDVSKQNYMIKQGRVLYIIAKDRVVQCSIAGNALSFEEARAIDFPRVNYNSFADRITIY